MKTKVGIGRKGKTLKHMLEESDRLWKQTGHYYGLKDLDLATKDPLRLELFHSRILASLQAGRETTRMVSASPLVREVAELCCGLYTPEGDCIAQSSGIAGHIPVMGQVVNWMIRQNYEEDVGIAEGDLFTCNDNVISGMHSADVYDLTPVFWEGELVAWAVTAIMEPEIGAVTPGTMPATATEKFADGFHICAEKIGTNDLLSKTFETRCHLLLRLSDLFLLDRKGAQSANIKIREEAKEIIREFGIDYFRSAARELIESERRSQLARVRTRTVPGRYRNVLVNQEFYSHHLVPPIHAKDVSVLIPLEFTIEPSGKYVLDFDGIGPWGWHPTNCTPSALLGGLSVAMVQSIAHTGKANMGTLLATELRVPYDSLYWPTNKFISTNLTWVCICGIFGLWMSTQCRGFFSRGFREEIMLGAIGGAGLEFAGKNQIGMEPFGFLMTESPGTGGSGACGIRDGVDNGFVIYTPEADMGSAEIWELMLPILWLGRRMLPDSAAHGRFRSGYSIVSTIMIYRAPYLFVGCPPGAIDLIPLNASMFGGYPNMHNYSAYIKDPNLQELAAEKKPLLHGLGDPRDPDILKMAKGKVGGPYGSTARVYDDVLKHGDVIQTYVHASGGGYGDPIERDLHMAKKDLDNGVLSQEICRRVYCIEATFNPKTDEWVIDEEKTKELRAKERERRLKSMPTREWWVRSRKKVVGAELPPLLKQMYNSSLVVEKELPAKYDPIWNTSGGNITCLPKGQKWPHEFRAFWNLSQDFTF